MNQEIAELTDKISTLFENINELVEIEIPHFRFFTQQVERGEITDLKVIDWELSKMLDYCYNDEILTLYKRILKCLVEEQYALVESYVLLYREIWEEEGIGEY
jgi:hypothetical protein